VDPDLSHAVRGDDGLLRCPWGSAPEDYRSYHDDEWGRPVRGDDALFERLSLEAFQAGLSWLTILRKRAAFREAFVRFDPRVVARFEAADIERLMADAAIVRNRQKIEAVIGNARALLSLQEADRSLDDVVWSHQPPARLRPSSMADVPTRTVESAALSAELRRAGFRFVGPTTMYAAMQACGLVDDHLKDCHVVARA